jgi:prefoldin subunit 5
VEGAVINERIEALDAQIAALRAALTRLQGVDSEK